MQTTDPAPESQPPNDGGPIVSPNGGSKTPFPGMSLRDYFAAKVMPELLRNVFSQKEHRDQVMAISFRELAATAYKLADAVLTERDKGEVPEAAEWSDKPIPEDDMIARAHPMNSGSHETYQEAHRFVSAKRSKAALVDLVNWLIWRHRSSI